MVYLGSKHSFPKCDFSSLLSFPLYFFMRHDLCAARQQQNEFFFLKGKENSEGGERKGTQAQGLLKFQEG